MGHALDETGLACLDQCIYNVEARRDEYRRGGCYTILSTLNMLEISIVKSCFCFNGKEFCGPET